MPPSEGRIWIFDSEDDGTGRRIETVSPQSKGISTVQLNRLLDAANLFTGAPSGV